MFFPPWLLIYDPPKSEDFTKTIRPAGYHSLFAPPVPEDKTELERIFGLPAPGAAPYDASRLYFFSIAIDKDRLMIQLGGVLAIAVLLVLLGVLIELNSVPCLRFSKGSI